MYVMLLCGLLFSPQTDEQKQLNKQVTEFARKFYLAYENGDVDAVLGMAVVPWYQDGKAIIRSQDELKVELKKFLDQRDTSSGKHVPDIKLVAGFGAMKDRTAPKDRELLEQVARDDDYLALVMLKPAESTKNNKSENVVLLVRLKDGKAYAIGVKHTP